MTFGLLASGPAAAPRKLSAALDVAAFGVRTVRQARAHCVVTHNPEG